MQTKNMCSSKYCTVRHFIGARSAVFCILNLKIYKKKRQINIKRMQKKHISVFTLKGTLISWINAKMFVSELRLNAWKNATTTMSANTPANENWAIALIVSFTFKIPFLFLIILYVIKLLGKVFFHFQNDAFTGPQYV